MRLLQRCDTGEIILTQFGDEGIPPYAILSHTWGADAEEVTFEDLMAPARISLAIRRSDFVQSRQSQMTCSTFGSTPVALTREAAQSYQKQSTQCIVGTKMPMHATRILPMYRLKPNSQIAGGLPEDGPSKSYLRRRKSCFLMKSTKN
jgi:hypothetical protein